MSHALLLRLFLSPYFSISVAMHYLKTYPDSIGISHYLCWRMKGMRTDEVEFYWPQICHLLITRPSTSNALECFVLERAEESTHSAMLTFWFMQSALRDLSATRQTNPEPFRICQRVLHRCHEIVFGDPPEPSASPYRSLPTTPPGSSSVLNLSGIVGGGGGNALTRLGTSVYRPGGSGARRRQKVNAHAAPAIIGMGVVLASTPGMPAIAAHSGQVALAQGRRPLDGGVDDGRMRVEVDREGGADVVPRLLERGVAGDDGPVADDHSDLEDWKAKRKASVNGLGGVGNHKSVVDLSDGASSRRPAAGASTSPAKSPLAADAPKRKMSSGSGSGSGSGDLAGSPKKETFAKMMLDQARRRPSGGGGGGGGSIARHPSHTSPSLTQENGATMSTSDLPSRGASSRRVSGGPGSPTVTVKGSEMGSPRPSSHRRTSSGRSGGPHAAFYSVPAFPTVKQDQVLAHMPSADSLLAAYDLDAQRQLLRSHYCRSEFRFLQTLEDISNRLLVIPKPARVSALRAELTSLNHNLPAEVCMPMWCPADHSHEAGGETAAGATLAERPDKQPRNRVRGHHRVVRISPGDSVVLNSAERAPYLLHLEILEDDLDFDPSKRANRELLKKIVVQIERTKRKREGIETIEYSPASVGLATKPAPRKRSSVSHTSNGQRKLSNASQSSPKLGISSSSSSAPEEMDLVEQLFGSNFSLRDQPPDLSDSIPVALAPQNKQADSVTWSQSTQPSPRIPQSAAFTNGVDTSAAPKPLVDRRESAQTVTSRPSAELLTPPLAPPSTKSDRPVITLEDYSERMRTAAVMLAQLNASMLPEKPTPAENSSGGIKWIPGTGWIMGTNSHQSIEFGTPPTFGSGSVKLQTGEAEAIRQRIMQEMMSLEEERVSRMTSKPEGVTIQPSASDDKSAEDESIIRRELNKADPSAVVFSESWASKQSRIRAASPWGHLAAWNVLSVIVKTGTDLRQEQLATQLIELFGKIFRDEGSECWVRFFRILITGDNSGLVETITDAVSIHSIKKAEYARRMTSGALGNVSLLDHFVNVSRCDHPQWIALTSLQTYGPMDSGRYARAQRNFIKSLAGYSIVTYLLQIKDRHNGNILVDRDGHLIHIDFGFMLSNSPGGNMGFEAAPFKLPMEYIDIMGGLDSPGFQMFRKLFKEGFEAARKHSDRIITIVELMQRNSKLDCFVMFGEQTAQHLRDRFQLGLTQAAVDAYLDRLIVSSIGSNWTRLYDSFQYYSQGVL